MATALYDVVRWVKDNGEVKAIDRLRVVALPALLEEGLILGAIVPETPYSAELLKKLKDHAATIVGQPCPV